jgi:hypothetical protein
LNNTNYSNKNLNIGIDISNFHIKPTYYKINTHSNTNTSNNTYTYIQTQILTKNTTDIFLIEKEKYKNEKIEENKENGKREELNKNYNINPNPDLNPIPIPNPNPNINSKFFLRQIDYKKIKNIKSEFLKTTKKETLIKIKSIDSDIIIHKDSPDAYIKEKVIFLPSTGNYKKIIKKFSILGTSNKLESFKLSSGYFIFK